MNDDDLPIGQFARLCRLSVKQLRHYDAVGLLQPARVDAHTGYRYYRAEQARDAMMISLMRSLEVPLSMISLVLGGELGELKRHRDDLEADLRRKQVAIATVERILGEGLPRPEVLLVTEPDHRVSVARGVASEVARIGAVTSECVARLLPRNQLIGLFPVDFTEPIEIAVAAIDPGGDEILRGGQFAQAVHIGPYDQISLTAHALLSWCAAHGHAWTGPVREVYLSNPIVTPIEQLVTELMLPLEQT